ncbi:hypothetical protein V6Z11_D10G245100 [Gossypium hirsutum]
MANDYKARSLEETPTWAVAVVCFVLVVISIFIEHAIHIVGKWFKKRHKTSLYEALEKIKAELMLMGFISLLLTVFQGPISEICIPAHVANTWHPCNTKTEAEKYSEKSSGRKLVEFSDDDSFYIPRRSLASKSDKCAEQGKVAFVSAYGIHQLHIFIFVLAVCHILYCIIIYALGRTKMRKWKAWENETKTIEYQFYNDPDRFRFARDTSFGRRHLSFWSRSTLTLWIVCFFRQFFGSVTKVDYLTLRHGFIMAHLAPGNETKFDFQKYIKRSLEDDFKVVVGISPIIWFIAVLFLLAYTHGWYSYLWLPFIPLIYEFTIRSCYHEHIEDVIIRVSMGVIIQFLCSYVTLPLYALVTRMGTNMRPTIFTDRVATALKNWHHTAKKHTKQSRLLHSENTTPFSSRPATPTHGMSPVHILHKHPQRSETYGISSGHSVDHWDPGLFHSPLHSHEINDPIHDRTQIEVRDVDRTVQESGSSQMDDATPQTIRTQHEIDIIPSDFSFAKN